MSKNYYYLLFAYSLYIFCRKEKEFEESMDHLQNDIDSLETERISLRDKLKSFSSKKGDLKQSTAFGNLQTKMLCPKFINIFI